MVIKRHLFIIGMGVLLFSALIAHPAPTQAADAVVGTGTAASCTETAFDTAIATANSGGGTITFDCGGEATISLTSQKIINASDATVTIDGNNQITLDGANRTRIFRVANGGETSLTLRNITLTNGRAEGYPDDGDDGSQGGAILFGFGNDTLRIENSRFINNTAVTNGFRWDGGGAIHIRIGQLFISDSLFEGNTAPNGGAMNILITTGTITNTVFRGNSATPPADGGGGGAIYIDNGMLTFDRILVENNTSGKFGGGYFNCGGSRNIGHETIINSTFRNNTITGTDGTGAGVYNCDDGISISGTTINNNTGPTHAGGFWHHSNSNPGSTATVLNSTISNNVATSGNGAGVTSNGPAPMTITNSLIVGNRTGVQGSAIRTGEGTVTLTNTIIANNSSAHEWVNTQCHGTIIDGGGNLQFPAENEDGRDARCSDSFPVNDPMLATLQDNGGPTPTHALLSGSPAIDAAPSCPVAVDQRGVTRPQGAACDIGPFEASSDDGEIVSGLPSDLNVMMDDTNPVIMPTFTWTHRASGEATSVPGDWYHVYVQLSYGTAELWFEASAVCSGTTCTANPNNAFRIGGAHPLPYGVFNGNHQFWVGAWTEQSNGSWTSLYSAGANFEVNRPAPGTIERLSPTTSDDAPTSFRWTADANASWYRIYAGGDNGVVFDQWFDTREVCSDGTCNASFPSWMTSGNYQWWMAGWGPGGQGEWDLEPFSFVIP